MNHPHIGAYAPPPGFVPVRSHVDGVEVYAPVAPDAEIETRTRCGACGAGVSWDPRAAKVSCPYCAWSGDPRAGVNTGPGVFNAEALVSAARGWGAERRELHCDGCGADLALDPARIATVCPLCGSSHVGLRPAAEQVARPTAVLPFTVDGERARDAARAWLAEEWMRPPGIASAARLDALQGIYLPYWIFSATLRARFKVEVGRDRVVETRRDGRVERRTVTDWSWVTGELEMASGEVAVAGTHRVPSLERVGAFPLAGRVPYTPDVLVGFGAQGAEIALPDGWAAGRATMREMAASACLRRAGGDRQRNLSATVDLDDETWEAVLLPAWVTGYTWGGKSWQVVVNGATAEVGGTRPVAWARVWLAVFGLQVPGVAIGVCIGLPTLVFAGFGLVVWMFALILMLIGAAVGYALYAQALHEEGR